MMMTNLMRGEEQSEEMQRKLMQIKKIKVLKNLK